MVGLEVPTGASGLKRRGSDEGAESSQPDGRIGTGRRGLRGLLDMVRLVLVRQQRCEEIAHLQRWGGRTDGVDGWADSMDAMGERVCGSTRAPQGG